MWTICVVSVCLFFLLSSVPLSCSTESFDSRMTRGVVLWEVMNKPTAPTRVLVQTQPLILPGKYLQLELWGHILSTGLTLFFKVQV